MPILAIDFGTTTTVAAVRADGSPPRLLAIDGSPLMPSSVFLTESGTLTVGRDADRQARLDPSRYEPNPKRRIDDGEVMLGVSAIPVVELIAAVLRRVGSEVTRQFGSLPADVRLTHPARWGRVRRRLLLDAARAAGLGENPMLIPEPVAAATHYAQLGQHSLGPQAGVAVYDLGGGTFDVAVLRRSGPTWSVVAEAGLTDLGGVDFDQAIVEHIAGRQAGPHQAEWDAMLAAADPASRRLRRAFETDVRDCKEALSRYAQAEVPMPEPFSDELLTRAEFEGLIRDKLARTVDLLAEQLSRGEVGEQALAGVYLVGGSSRIPLVARLIQEQLGITPTTLDQPETSVATGALLVPADSVPGLLGTQAPPVPPGYRPGYGPGTGTAPTQPGAPSQPMPSGQVPQTGPIPSGQVPSGPVPSGSVPSGQVPSGQVPSGSVPSGHIAARQIPSGPVPQAGQFPSGQVRSGQFPSGVHTPPNGQNRPSYGPPTQGPMPSRPPGQSNSRRLRWIAPLGGVVAIAVAAVIVVVVRDNSGHGSAHGATTSSPTQTPTASADASTNSAVSGAQTKFDRYFPDPDVQAYMRPSYKVISSCEQPQNGETYCQLKNGLTVAVGTGVTGARQQTLPGTSNSIVHNPHTSWKEQRWDKGEGSGELRTWLGRDKPDSPLLYWDRNGSVYGFLGIEKGSVTTTTAASLLATWKANFEH